MLRCPAWAILDIREQMSVAATLDLQGDWLIVLAVLLEEVAQKALLQIGGLW